MKHVVFSRSPLLFLLPLCLLPTAWADFSQLSADYNFTCESTDGGGLRVASADYLSDGSVSPGDFITSGDYVQRGGYIGQLNNPPAVTSHTVNRGSNSVVRILLSVLTNSVTDAEGDTVSFSAFNNMTEQNGGAVELGNKFLQYQAPTNYNGNDTIFWTALDSEGDSSPETVLLRVPTPPDGRPTLNLISLNVSGARATLVFAGFPQATFETPVQVQYTDSLSPANWQNLGATTVTNGILTIVDPTGGNASGRFYRTVYP